MSVDTIRRHQSFEPEAYHELIDSQSRYATLFVAISPAEAAAILAVYGARFINRADACTTEHLTAMQNLNNRVEKVLNDSDSLGDPDENKEYFVRLSSRSPKDGIPLGADQLRTALVQLMRDHGVTHDVTSHTSQPTTAHRSNYADSVASTTEAAATAAYDADSDSPARLNAEQSNAEVGSSTDPALAMEYDALLSSGLTPKEMNDMACAAFALMHEFMRISTSSEVLALLTSSERVAIDLSRALDAFAEDPSSWRQHICLRAWERRIQDRFEFRCFVHEGRLTAVSQYNTYVCIDELADDAEFRTMVFARLVDAWKKNFQHALAGIGSYVCDLAYCSETGEVILIELNPPEPTTGSGLFDWQRDANILTGLGHTVCDGHNEHKTERQAHGSDKLAGEAADDSALASFVGSPATDMTDMTDMTIEGEASSAVYIQEMIGGVVCRARPHAPPVQQLAGMLHMFVGETIRELHGPRERWHYTFAMDSLHARIWSEERNHNMNAMTACSQKIAQIQCSIL